MPNTIKRTIEFYKIKWENNNGEYFVQDNEFFSLIFNNIDFNYFDESNGVGVGVEHLDKYDNTDWFFGKIAKTKSKDFPLKYNVYEKTVSGIELKSNERLYIPTHFGIYKGQILICENVFEGLSANSVLKNRINHSLKNNVSNISSIKFNPLLHEDIKEYLTNNKIRGVTIGVASDNLSNLVEKNSIFSRLNELKSPKNIDVEVTFSLNKRRSDKAYSAMDDVMDNIEDILYNEDIHTNLSKLKVIVKDENLGKNEINLLKPVFKSKEEFIRMDDETKGLDEKDAFSKIKSLYNKYRSEIDNVMEIVNEG